MTTTADEKMQGSQLTSSSGQTSATLLMDRTVSRSFPDTDSVNNGVFFIEG